jgi:hypothetical protein
MIYQLLRLDGRTVRLERLFLGVVLGGAGFAVLTGRPSSTISWGMVLNFLLYALVFSLTRYRATLFQAALPIPARDLFMARLLPLLAVVWIPLLAAVGAGYVVGARATSIRALWLIAVGAVCTAAGIVLLSVRLRELSAPRVLANFLLLSALTGGVVSIFWPGIVLAVCAGMIAALLWRDLASMPKAFQVAPADAAAGRLARRWIGFARPVCWPVFRSMFTGQSSGMFIWSAAMLLNPWSSFMAGLMLGVFISRGGRTSMSWVWPLPVSRRKVLALGLLPVLVLEAAVLAARPAGFIQAVELVVVALLSTSFFLAMINWNRLRAGARFLVACGLTSCLCGPIALSYFDISRMDRIHQHRFSRSYTAEYLAAHLARIPPPLLLLLVVGTLAGLGALYWLAQRQFEAADFLPPAHARLDTAEFSIGNGA